ncbi:MAG TPA: FAD-dependent oxidoreductase, partial [Armatimonadota bacterium]|nr:FAD-dependent oxidoreductase [Armatimonadota bacterium]
MPTARPCLFLEAEQFADHGGWVVDQQFMDVMGSPFLLAHGLGRPVADAMTAVEVPAGGRYRVWVRTRDWAAPWGPGAPGRFQVLVNGRPLAATFGTVGAEWHWQDGGMVDLPAGPATVALHDLTGFAGRCDALLFSAVPDGIPPHDPDALAAFRRAALGLPEAPDDGGRYDLVVAGGGIAGLCAAVAAARMGLSVALLHDRPVVGGNNSYEVCVNMAGETHLEPYPRLGDLVRALESPARLLAGSDTAAPTDDPRLALLAAEPRLTLLTSHRLIGAETAGGRVTAVTAQEIISGRRLRIESRWFADCTGDGNLGYHAGADHDITLTGHMGPTNVWRVRDTGAPAPFPRCPWAADLRDRPFPGRDEWSAQWARPGLHSLGQWFWESGFDFDPIADAERSRDRNFHAMYGAWDALKNVDGRYPHHALSWAAYIAGTRESRRLFGDVIVTRGDLFRQTAFPDACVPCTWHMDLHVPHRDYQRGFEGDEFISWCVQGPFPAPFWLPYRALYSRNLGNLFMAGRDISVTHEALGAVRVMATTGMMGEVV